MRKYLLALTFVALTTVTALAYTLLNFHYVAEDNIGTAFYVSDTKTATSTGYAYMLKRVFSTAQVIDGVLDVKTVIYSEQVNCVANTHDVLTAEYFDANGTSISFQVLSWMGFVTKPGSVGVLIKEDVCK